jgi:hypothetical protein
VTAHPFNRMSFHRTKEGHARALDAGSNPLHRDTPVEDVDERWVTACLKKIFQAHAAEAFERSVRADEAESGYWLDAAKMPKRPSVAGKSQSARPWEDRRDVALAALGKAGAQHQLPLLKEKELKRKEAASLFVKLGFKSTAVSEDWLEKAAVKGSKKNGPPFNKVNGRVTYDLASLLEWFLRRRQQG